MKSHINLLNEVSFLRRTPQLTQKTIPLLAFLFAMSLCSGSLHAATIYSNAVTGNWSTKGSWVGNVVPTSTDDVVIVNGANITTQGSTTINSLTIDAGGILSDNGTSTTVTGDITINGTWTGNATVTLSGANKNISGTGVISNTSSFSITANKTILGSTSLIKGSGALALSASVTITNNGSITIGGAITGAGSGATLSVWTNASNSTLNIGGALLSTGTLNASATGNTVNFYSSSAQNVKRPGTSAGGNLGVYHHLTISGASSATKSLQSGTYTINGNLTINSALDANTRNIILLGNWINSGGTFSSTASVTFGGTASQSLSTVTAESFYDLTISNSSGIVANNSFSATNSLTMTSGNIDMGSNTLTLGSSTSIGSLSYGGGSIIGSFERWIGSTTSPSSPVLFPVGTSTNYRPLSVTFNTLTTPGSVTAKFTSSAPGNNGLPITDGTVTLHNTFRDGYWSLTANSLVSSDFNLDLTGNGFSGFTITNNTRILTRATSSASWTNDGSNSTRSGNTIKRINVTTLSGEFCFGDDTNCSAPNTSSITAVSGTEICNGATNQVYSVTNTGGSSYAWLVSSGGTIASGQGSNSISVDWSTSGGARTVSVTEDNGCTLGSQITENINVHPLAPGSITGKANVPNNGSTTEAYSIAQSTGYSYTWQVVGNGTITSGQNSSSVNVQWGNVGSATVMVSGTYSGCSGTSDFSTLAVDIYSVIYSNKTTGNWGTNNSWTCNCTPGASDNVVILNGHTISSTSGTEVKHLTINTGGILNMSNPMTVYGDLNLNGSITGTSLLTLSSSVSNPIIDGIGTISTTPVTIASTRSINSTATITKTSSSGAFSVGAGVVVTNNGSITLTGALTAGSSTSTWINSNNSTLSVGGALFSSPAGILTASATGNTVKYAGSVANANIKLPSSSQYYNLLIANTGGTRTAPASTLKISGDFTNNSTSAVSPAFDANGGTIEFNGSSIISGSLTTAFNNILITGSLTSSSGAVGVTGNFTNNGTFTHNSGTVNFNGTNAQTISGNNSSFYNLTANNSSISGLTVSSPQTVDNILTLTANKLTLSSAVTMLNSTSTVMLAAGTLVNTAGLIMASGATINSSGGVISTSSPTGGPWKLIYSGSSPVSTGLEIPSSGSLLSLSSTNSNTVTLNSGITIGSGGFSLNSSIGTFDSNGAHDISTSSLAVTNGIFKAPSSNLTVTGDITMGPTSGTGNGSYTHSSGTVIFGGTTAQTVTGVNAASAVFNSITINSNAIFNAPASLTMQGSLLNNGTINAGTGTFVFTGDNAKTISGSLATKFNNITVNNGAQATDLSFTSNQTLAGVLSLAGANTKVGSDGYLTLLSSGDSPAIDASIAALPSGADVTGDVTIQRYMSAEPPSPAQGIYRYLSSPITNAKVSDWQNYFSITGNFTNHSTTDPSTGTNQVCGFTINPTSPSMFIYNEATKAYTNYPTSNASEPLVPGQGYAAYVRNCSSPTVIQLKGPINKGPFDFALSPLKLTYTPGSAPYDGYNLVGNPFPSTIDWQSPGWTKSNISPVIAIRDNGSGVGNFVYLDGSSAAHYIASGQGFWVRTTGSNPVLSADETVKAAPSTSFQFYRQANPAEDNLTISLNNGKITDYAFVKINTASSLSLDDFDGPKLDNDFLNLSTLSSDNIKMAINSVNSLSCGGQILVNIVKPGATTIPNGSYQLSFSGKGFFSSSVTMTLHDSFTGTTQNISENPSYNFTASSKVIKSNLANRFTITLSEKSIPLDNVVESNVLACGQSPASITLNNSVSGVDYFATIHDQVVSATLSGNGNPLLFTIPSSNLSVAGDTVVFKAQGMCSSTAYSLNQTSIIRRDTSLYLAKSSGALNCGPASVTILASGAAQSGNYNWYSNADDQVPLFTGAVFTTQVLNETKTYYVAATNSLGCEGERVSVKAVITSVDPTLLTTATGASNCGVGSVTLSAIGASSTGTYNWYDSLNAVIPTYVGVSFSTPTLSKSKIYFVAATNTTGCEGPRASVNADIQIMEDATITVQNDLKTLKSNYSGGNQWYRNGTIIVGATNQTYVPVQDGNYTVSVSSSICSVTSVPVIFLVTAIEEQGDVTIKAYPNPVKNFLTIELDGEKSVNGELYNQLGQVVSGVNFTNEGIKQTAKCDFTRNSSGVYLLKINQGSEIKYVRIVKE